MGWRTGLVSAVTGWASFGFDLLCPPRCAACRADLSVADAAAVATVPLCAACGRLLSVDAARCGSCGDPVTGSGDCRCRRCRRGLRADWDGIVVLGGYGEELREAVLRAKRPAGNDLAVALAALLHRTHAETLSAWGIDAVVPVPMHWLRRAARGISLADELAGRLARCLRVPCLPLLRRRRRTPMQNTLPVEHRRGNVRNAFGVRGRPAGRRLLLVDDVVTTGGTLAECRKTLVAAGATAVFAAAVAKAERGRDADRKA